MLNAEIAPPPRPGGQYAPSQPLPASQPPTAPPSKQQAPIRARLWAGLRNQGGAGGAGRGRGLAVDVAPFPGGPWACFLLSASGQPPATGLYPQSAGPD